jgi:SAM-dependent methyltransferase
MIEATNSLIGKTGLRLIRKHSWEDARTYIPHEQTITEARKAGLSVGDYIDVMYNVPGATDETIRKMTAFGVFRQPLQRVCEIGPGSGRYLAKTLEACSPEYYEVYETAPDWARWLAQRYPVVLQPTDGNSLAGTPSSSIDLVHAHKVFSSTPFLTTMRYLHEAVRVLKTGSRLVFDILDEDCMEGGRLEEWTACRIATGIYPTIMPRDFTRDYFCKRGFQLDGEFFIPLKPGITHYFVFTKARKE